MLYRAILLPFFLSLFCPSYALAEFYSGNKLKDYLEKWESSSPGIDAAIGAGYVVGVYDSRVGLDFCPPSSSSITVGQITSMVLKYMKENPDKLHKTGDLLVLVALARVWPCAARQQGTSPSTLSPAPTPIAPITKPKPKPKEETSPF